MSGASPFSGGLSTGGGGISTGAGPSTSGDIFKKFGSISSGSGSGLDVFGNQKPFYMQSGFLIGGLIVGIGGFFLMKKKG